MKQRQSMKAGRTKGLKVYVNNSVLLASDVTLLITRGDSGIYRTERVSRLAGITVLAERKKQ